MTHSGTNSAITSDNYQNLYSSMQAERKSPRDYDQGGDNIEKALESMESARKFAIALLMASAKNMGIPGDGDSDSNQASEMMQISRGIAEMQATEAEILATKALIEVQKNPAVNLMDLKDKIVDYDDSTRNFQGKPISFSYDISHSEKSESALIANIFTIRDAQGNTVKTVSQPGKAGSHEFIWDGTDNKDQKVPNSEYSISVESSGHKIVNGTRIPFAVEATTNLSGIVESIKIEKGVANSIVINGKPIMRDQISGVREPEEVEADLSLTPDLIGKYARLDLDRAQVKDGSMDVYFHNHTEHSGVLSVQIYDENDKLLKTITSTEQAGSGMGKLTLDDVGLENGDYNLKIHLRSEQLDQDIRLNDSIIDVAVAGINPREGNFMSARENSFSPHNIQFIVGNYLNPIQQRQAEYTNSEIVYRDDGFIFKGGNPMEFSSVAKKPQEDGSILSHVDMRIYSADGNSDLVAIVRGEYDLYSMLDSDSAAIVDNWDEQDPIAKNRFIEDGLLDGGELHLEEEYENSYKDNVVSVDFTWNGEFMGADDLHASEGQKFQRTTTPIYIKEDGTIYGGETMIPTKNAFALSVDQAEGELTLNLANGQKIPEELVMDSRKLS
ncbi:MAG: hypothetical protein COA94_00795 [Rickettsiales bacterium]|nr:MAG: hypothetical protein COA94_00795 [Rickettsiales bacterium]